MRSIASLGAAVLVAGVPFTQRPAAIAAADPPRYAAAVGDARVAADAADSALAAAADALDRAIDAGRAASANASTGTAVEEGRFTDAAARARDAAAPLATARLALGRLAGRCATLGLAAPGLAANPAVATAAGDGIADAVPAASGFIGLRADTSLVLDELAAAARALGARDVAAAGSAADRAEAALGRVEPFGVALPALRLWLETAGDLLAAVRSTVSAIDDGDAQAAEEAEARLRDAAGEAAVSDRALSLAISEGASRVLGTQLGQLAGLAREIADARSTLDALRRALVARAGGASERGEAP
jgi:hypothetical protein